ncbi:MAG: type IV pilus twitching motility protein PilT [Candidatus Nanopelagicales bacterium]|nr:type IV pilus twitching motility protein PilT [Candidatus Nanopelagicales bacterium]
MSQSGQGDDIRFAPSRAPESPTPGLVPPVGPMPSVPDAPRVADPVAKPKAYERATTETKIRKGDISLLDLLDRVTDLGASDLHIAAESHPVVRINGALHLLEDFPVLDKAMIQRVLYAIITQDQRERFEEELELDFSYALPGRSRFRVNLYRQKDALGAAFRLIPQEIRSLEELGIPPVVRDFASLPRGFVLVTGPTGSGKSTTLAALIDLANSTRHDHIMTVEDPIEFLHSHKSCLVNQREVGTDTWSYNQALKHVLRQDPDIILVGEMRDLETISVALTAAETGHLVFATLHTQDAAQTIDRVIDVFPPSQQQQVRQQLASSFQGVVCQTLCKSADGQSRVVAVEVLTITPAVRNLIREGKTHQLYSAMQAGAKFGMQTMDQHLAKLVLANRITYETGLEKCHQIEDFNRLAGRSSH